MIGPVGGKGTGSERYWEGDRGLVLNPLLQRRSVVLFFPSRLLHFTAANVPDLMGRVRSRCIR